jgi:PAS domain S-box-containing protein
MDKTNAAELRKRCEEAEGKLVQSHKRFSMQRDGIVRLFTDETFARDDLGKSLNRITRMVTETLGVDRASVWRFSDDITELKCLTLYESSKDKYSRCPVIPEEIFSLYFKAIKDEHFLCVADTETDQRTVELSESYLKPHNIKSLIDAGIIVNGRLKGVVCCEHTGYKRKWEPDEEYFVSTIAAFVAQLFSVNERKQIEKVLMDSEDRFRMFAELAPVGIVISDNKENSLYVSKKFTEIFGYTIYDIPTVNDWYLLAYPNMELRAKVQKEWAETIDSARKTGQDIAPLEYPVICLDGTVKHIEFRVASTGELNFIVFTDISGRKHHEAEIEAFNEELMATTDALKDKNESLIQARKKAEESDRLKSAFLANMSHEIRTPINAILGFSSFLKDPGKSKKDIDRYVTIINNSGQHLLNLIDDIVDISKIDAGLIRVVKSSVNLKTLLGEIFILINSQIPQDKQENIRIVNNFSGMDFHICTDETRLKQVLINLLNNALKFTDQGVIEFGYHLLDGVIKFYVSDTGIGIPHDKQQTVFDRFTQAADTNEKFYGGTGLGLSIARACTEMLGGRIWVESKPGEGSTFYFTIKYHKCQDSTGDAD